MSNLTKIVLFGGQGSLSPFSSRGALTAANDAKSSSAAAILLSKCHAAFLKDSQGLAEAGSEVSWNKYDIFTSPQQLLAPDAAYHQDPIIQGTTLCLHQLLRYLSNLEDMGSNVESSIHKIGETAGLCSGVLPAAVVASSASVAKFIEFGVGAFRLAFWASYRSALYCQKLLKSGWKDIPWSLVIIGLNKDQILAKLQEFHSQSESKSLNLAVISSHLSITLSGPGPDLAAFRNYCSPASSMRFVNIHALYHGGENLHSVVEEVSKDLETRNITFPSFADLKKPLRSTLDGAFLLQGKEKTDTLAETLLRVLLVQTVDWSMTSAEISKAAHKSLDHDPNMEIEIESFGPSSTSLLAEIRRQQHNPRMRVTDVSQSLLPPKHSGVKDAIAIIGMAVNFPGGKGAPALWETLLGGFSTVEEIPKSRFDLSQFYDPQATQTKGRKMTSKLGNFIEDVWSFDNSFFNTSAREARSMDPQSRILLHMAQRALEDAGYSEDATSSFQRKSFGCYIGVATEDYKDNLRNDIDVYYSPGTLRAFLSGKISYYYRMSGPSVVVDTACSSSLVAIQQACRALQNGDCSSAVAGGVNVICSPDMFLGLSRAHLLSPTGQCKSFDKEADGYSRAEGCGVFILKRLSEAIAENDRIHGVIKGIEVNQSASSHSITHPHAETQADLFQRLLQVTRVLPASVSVVEAHGTGTQAGDFSEISSLHSVFAKSRSLEKPLIVSSIKGNIGHAEAASGSAGLAKLLLMFRQGIIPRQASLSNLNPRLENFIGNGITIPLKTQEWKSSSDVPRRALLNNFGAAGSNAALLLEEYVSSESQLEQPPDRSSYLFNVSARSTRALETLVKEYQQYLEVKRQQLNISDICYTATARRQNYEHRISFVCNSVNDLLGQLSSFSLDQWNKKEQAKSVVFVFSGQGSSYFGMGKELIETSPLFKSILENSDRYLRSLGFPGILHLLQSKDSSADSKDENDQMISFQCACVVIEYALAKLWMSWNVIPDMLIGHSLGEYAAIAVSDAISLEETLRVVATRAQLMTKYCAAHSSGMVACRFSSRRAEEMLTQSIDFTDMTVACHNSMKDCVVAGPLKQLKAFESHCSSLGEKTIKLQVPYGFHSSAMDPILQPLEQLGRSVNFSKPKINIVSNVTGRLMSLEDLSITYFSRHARQPVLFVDSIQHLQEEQSMNAAVVLEMGPHPITLPMVRATLSTTTFTCLPTLHRDLEAWSSLTASLSQLYSLKDGIKWRTVFDGTRPTLLDLPGHPLSTSEIYFPYHEPILSSTIAGISRSYIKTGYSLLPELSKSRGTDSFTFETTIFTLAQYISGHVVGGSPICPASIFHELVLEAAQSASQLSEDTVYVVHDMVFTNPLVYNAAHQDHTVHVFLEEAPSKAGVHFTILAQMDSSSPKTLHCSGTVYAEKVDNVRNSWLPKKGMVKRQQAHLFTDSGSTLNTFRTKMLYDVVFRRVVEYSERYQTLKLLSVSQLCDEGYGTFQLSDYSKTERLITPPPFIDTLLHTAGFIANANVGTTDACICNKVESIKLLHGHIDFGKTFTVYCSLFDGDQGMVIADAYALDYTGSIVAAVEGVHFKKVRLSSFQAVLKRDVGRLPVTNVSSDQISPASMVSENSTGAIHEAVTPYERDFQQQELRAKLSHVIMNSCELDDNQVNATADLRTLGIDSMMMIELVSTVEQLFPGKPIDGSELINCQNIQELEDAILSKHGTPKTPSNSGSSHTIESNMSIDLHPEENTNKDANYTIDQGSKHLGARALAQTKKLLNCEDLPVVLQNKDLEATALCLFHDGSGLCNMYSHLEEVGRKTYGFFHPGFFDTQDQAPSLVKMAAYYASLIKSQMISPVILGGYSFGGVLALEVARQLSDVGEKVKGIILIDSPCPINHEPLPDPVIEHVVKVPSANGNESLIRQSLLRQFRTNAAMLGMYRLPPSAASAPHPKIVMLRSQDIFDCEALCGVHYPWLSSQEVRSDSIATWEMLVDQNIQVLDIPGNHFEAFSPQNIPSISKQLRKACYMVDAVRE